MVRPGTSEGLRALRHLLDGLVVSAEGAEPARVVTSSLPGRTAVATARVGGVLWVCLDLDKPSALRHAVALLEDGDVAVVELDPDDLPIPYTLADPPPATGRPLLRLVV